MADADVMERIETSGEVSEELKNKIVEALENVEDPELGIDIVNLGLVYGIERDEQGKTTIRMTLTAMGCPLAGQITTLVKHAMNPIDEISEVEVDVVWSPPWSKDRMSRYAKIALGIS